MSFQQLLSWLNVAQLEQKKASEVAEFVGAALDELEEDDPNYDFLLDIEDELAAGRVPRELLASLVHQNKVTEPVDEVERLSGEYRQIAESYLPEQWQSNYFLELSRHLEESDDEVLLTFVESLRSKLTQAWTKYSKDFSLMPGKSTETEVGHGLMKEAYETWMEALDLLDEGYPDAEILHAAEIAVRLLAAVNQLDKDVQRQAELLSSHPTFRTGR